MIDTGITYGALKSRIHAFCDADHASGEDRKPISGYILTLANVPIGWQAKRQTTVATSTVESEYAAIAPATNEAL